MLFQVATMINDILSYDYKLKAYRNVGKKKKKTAAIVLAKRS